jgi:hypothetical protein
MTSGIDICRKVNISAINTPRTMPKIDEGDDDRRERLGDPDENRILLLNNRLPGVGVGREDPVVSDRPRDHLPEEDEPHSSDDGRHALSDPLL